MKLLLSESAFQRVGNALRKLGVTPVLVNDQHAISAAGGDEISVDALRVDAIWATFDVFGGPKGRTFLSHALASARPRWVQNGGAGFDDAAFRDAVRGGAILSTSHGQADGMADFVIAAIMDHLQRGPERRAAQTERLWRRFPYREVQGTNWLIIGFGAIGQAVGVRGRALGARIVGVRRTQVADDAADEIAPLDRVMEHLPRADAVVLCVPLRRETRRIVDQAFLAAMKPDSLLVNVGRGALIDDAALLHALDNGIPARAALDVFETEPLPSDHSYWRHPRITVTPHNSPLGDRQVARNDALFLDNVRRFLAGATLLNVASPADVLANTDADDS